MTAKNGDSGVFKPQPVRYAACLGCVAKIGLHGDLKAGFQGVCTHCNASYRAWPRWAWAQREKNLS